MVGSLGFYNNQLFNILEEFTTEPSHKIINHNEYGGINVLEQN